MSVLIPRISPSVFLVAILAEFDHHVVTGGVASLPWTGLGFRADTVEKCVAARAGIKLTTLHC